MRAFISNGRPVITHGNPNLKAWRKTLCEAFKAHATGVKGEGFYQLDITFYFIRPKAHMNLVSGLRKSAPKGHCTRPDLDKLIRAVLDALTDSSVISDDSHVCAINATKQYGEEEGVNVCFSELS